MRQRAGGQPRIRSWSSNISAIPTRPPVSFLVRDRFVIHSSGFSSAQGNSVSRVSVGSVCLRTDKHDAKKHSARVYSPANVGVPVSRRRAVNSGYPTRSVYLAVANTTWISRTSSLRLFSAGLEGDRIVNKVVLVSSLRTVKHIAVSLPDSDFTELPNTVCLCHEPESH